MRRRLSTVTLAALAGPALFTWAAIAGCGGGVNNTAEYPDDPVKSAPDELESPGGTTGKSGTTGSSVED